jgi:anti-sigma factor RsiW
MMGQGAARQHSDFTLLMSLVLDDEATDAEAKALREHLAGCDACAHTWQRWQELDRRFMLAPVAPAPVDFSAAVAARLDQRVEEVRRRRLFIFGLAASWTVAVLGVVLALSLANGWYVQLLSGSGALSAGWAAMASIGEWVYRLLVDLVARAGTPTVAAGAGAVLIMTCGLATLWLWMVARLSPAGDRQFVSAE